ncbi:MAG: nitroreductase family protein [Thiovulaceae bacterium]|nr:nitroreductase family protein [Sulfurimonadaceae bacterium]
MEKQLQDIFDYHETTKHAPHRYARSLGYMDWETQPDPFRNFKGTSLISLPLALENPTPPYHLLLENDAIPSAPLVSQSLSQLFQFSLGLAAWKSTGVDKWALRCNASSGNLHPTEAYTILPPLEGISGQSTVTHYAPKSHALEILAEFDTNVWKDLPQGSFFVGLSSILWREAWKYGERAFRYCQLDVGHAWKALEVSALMLGWQIKVMDVLDDRSLAKLFGLDQENRFYKQEKEIPELLLLVSPVRVEDVNLDDLWEDLPMVYEGIVNKLSESHHDWPILDTIHEASSKMKENVTLSTKGYLPKAASLESKTVVLKRRSVQMMDKLQARMTYESFIALLQSVIVEEENFASVHLVLFVHAVQDLKQGIYILLRKKSDKELLQTQMKKSFLWKVIDEKLGVYLLEEADMQQTAKGFSCSQDIASDSSFSLGMLSHFSQEIVEFGPKRYKELYWECGAIGQQLYLEATSLNLSATGIGCFLDDTVHKILGLQDNRFQILYHFTIGRGLIDNRLLTLEPYHHLD